MYVHRFHCYYGPGIGIFIQVEGRLPEAICCCLQTCIVNVLFCFLLAFILTSADISQSFKL